MLMHLRPYDDCAPVGSRRSSVRDSVEMARANGRGVSPAKREVGAASAWRRLRAEAVTIASIGPPQRCAQPQPDVTIKV